MADWSMEPQVWVPCDFQQADWSMDHAIWVPGLSVSCESESTEMTCLDETPVHGSTGGQQLVEYAAVVTPKYGHPIPLKFERKAGELDHDNALRENRMYRYPPCIRDLDERYTVPMMVSIGPYHHGREHLKKAEEAKHAAAYTCMMASRRPLQEMYDAVVSVAGWARSLYDQEMVAGMDDKKDFWPMMFYDACFLVQWMLMFIGKPDHTVPWLSNFLNLNCKTIHHDMMLLENQLPWMVVETLMSFLSDTPVTLNRLAAKFRGSLQARIDQDMETFVFHGSYKRPHVLGFLRFYTVGIREELQTHAGQDDTAGGSEQPTGKAEEADVISFSVSAIELAEIGITLRPSNKLEIAHMGIQKAGLSSTELYLAPICLTYKRASFLVNMAAVELTASPSTEYDAVCNYLRLIGLLLHREEDVQELRSKKILQGGGGLTNEEALRFFASLQDLPVGNGYDRILREIQIYKQNHPLSVKAYKLWYKNKKIIYTLLGGFVSLASLLAAFIPVFQSK